MIETVTGNYSLILFYRVQSKRDDSLDTFSDIDISSTPIKTAAATDTINLHQLLQEANISSYYDPEEEEKKEKKDGKEGEERGRDKNGEQDVTGPIKEATPTGGAYSTVL